MITISDTLHQSAFVGALIGALGAMCAVFLDRFLQRRKDNRNIERLLKLILLEIDGIHDKTIEFISEIKVISDLESLHSKQDYFSKHLVYNENLFFIYKNNLPELSLLQDEEKLKLIYSVYHYLFVFLDSLETNIDLQGFVRDIQRQLKMHDGQNAEKNHENTLLVNHKESEMYNHFQSYVSDYVLQLEVAINQLHAYEQAHPLLSDMNWIQRIGSVFKKHP